MVSAAKPERLDEPRIRLKPGELGRPLDKATALADFIADEVEEQGTAILSELRRMTAALNQVLELARLAYSGPAKPPRGKTNRERGKS